MGGELGGAGGKRGRLNRAGSQLLSGGESSEHEALYFFPLFFVMLHRNLEMSGSNSWLFDRAQKYSEVALGAKSPSPPVNRCRGRLASS